MATLNDSSTEQVQRTDHHVHGQTRVGPLEHFEEYLTDEAKALYHSGKCFSTVEERRVFRKDGPDLFDRQAVFCQFLIKAVPLDGEGNLDPAWERRLALTFNKLVEAGKLELGVLGPAFRCDLAWGDVMMASGHVAHFPERRAIVGIYCFPSLETERAAGSQSCRRALGPFDDLQPTCGKEHQLIGMPLQVKDHLNEWLGNLAFVEEGAMGSQDWTNLPE